MELPFPEGFNNPLDVALGDMGYNLGSAVVLVELSDLEGLFQP